MLEETRVNTLKTCTKCQTPKPIDDFGRQTKSKDGRKNYCKVCFGELNKSRYEKKKKHIIKAVLRRRKQLKNQQNTQNIEQNVVPPVQPIAEQTT